MGLVFLEHLWNCNVIVFFFTCIESHHKLQFDNDIVEIMTQVIYIYIYRFQLVRFDVACQQLF
jgi:hypothetical protein